MLSFLAALFAFQSAPPRVADRAEPIAVPPPPAARVPAPPAPPRFRGPPPPLVRPAPRRAQARMPLAAYVTDADYPAAALRAEEEGSVGFRLVIGTDGRAVDCVVTATSGSAALDEATCRIMRSRTRFLPAIGAGGYPISDFLDSRLIWSIRDDPPSPQPARLWVQIAAGPTLDGLRPTLAGIRTRARSELDKRMIHTTADAEVRRLLVGPFETMAEAQAFAAALARRGVGGSAWASADGQLVVALAEP